MRNSLVKAHKETPCNIFFEEGFFFGFFFFIAPRSKRLATEIERTKQLKKQLLLVFLILSGLSQTLLSPSSPSSCSPHPQTQQGAPRTYKNTQLGRGKASQGARHSTARAARFGFVSPHQREGNERSGRSSLLLTLSSLLQCPAAPPGTRKLWQPHGMSPALILPRVLLCAHAGIEIN